MKEEINICKAQIEKLKDEYIKMHITEQERTNLIQENNIDAWGNIFLLRDNYEIFG